MASESFQSILNSLANTPQSVQSFFDFSKELFQNLYLWILNSGIILTSIMYIGILFAMIRGGIFLYNVYTADYKKVIRILYGINQGVSKFTGARTTGGKARAINETTKLISKKNVI